MTDVYLFLSILETGESMIKVLADSVPGGLQVVTFSLCLQIIERGEQAFRCHFLKGHQSYFHHENAAIFQVSPLMRLSILSLHENPCPPVCVRVSLSVMSDSLQPLWTVVRQAPLSM